MFTIQKEMYETLRSSELAGTVNVKLSTLDIIGQNVEQKNKGKILNPQKDKTFPMSMIRYQKGMEFSTRIFSICA